MRAPIEQHRTIIRTSHEIIKNIQMKSYDIRITTILKSKQSSQENLMKTLSTSYEHQQAVIGQHYIIIRKPFLIL